MVMVFLSHCYYFFGLLIFLANLGILFKLSKILKTQSWALSFQKVTKKRPEKKDLPDGEFQDYSNYNSVLILDFFWIFIGLITVNWKAFLLLLAAIFVVNLVLSFTNNFKPLNTLLNYTKILFITSSILIIVINHFHLHLDLFKTIQDYF